MALPRMSLLFGFCRMPRKMPEGTALLPAAPTAEAVDGRSPRILIARLSAIGDCILTMPLAVALRDAFPGAFIAWAVEGAAGTMIECHPAVDRAIRLPRRFVRSPTALLRLRRQLLSLRFDVAIDPQSLTKSALVAWLSGAARRIGFARPVGRELAPGLNTELVDCRQLHVVDRYRELLRPMGVAAGPVRFDFPGNAATDSAAGKQLEAAGLSAPFAVVNPGAGWESKRWPQQRFAEVARELNSRLRVRSLVVWGGTQERAWAEGIVAAAGDSAVVAPPTTLLELAALLRQASLFVGSDTGPLHMAAAVGTPCVAIFGPTRPEHCGPFGSGHQVLQAWYQGGTSRQRRLGPNDAMRDVPTSWVVDACLRALAPRLAQSAA
jgi:lipopolysaccharide heptosyltransferase I